ncbi:MAG TPA: HipA domain-containing protein [Thermoanaerobaculia bacterium]
MTEYSGQAFLVLLHDEPVAHLRVREDGSSALRFLDSYVQTTPRPVLSQKFEDWNLSKIRRFKSLPPFFQHLLPEGALREYIVRAELLADSDVELLRRLGRDLPGAVALIPEDVADDDVPGQIVDEPAVPPAVPMNRLRFSLAGVQLKFSAERKGRVTVPARGRSGRWIVKLPDRMHPRLPELEHSMMRWAAAVGFEVPETDVVSASEIEDIPPHLEWSEENAYVCRRFDRTEEGLPIHIEDFGQVFGAPLTHAAKYYTYGYLAIARTLSAIAGHDEMLLFLRRLVFDILCGNGDSHVKNWSVIYRDRFHARLAPAYDIVPTVLFPGYDQALALDFVGVTRFTEITRDRFRQFAKKLDMSPADLLAIVDETIVRAQDAFGTSARDWALTTEERAQMEAHWGQVPLLRGS